MRCTNCINPITCPKRRSLLDSICSLPSGSQRARTFTFARLPFALNSCIDDTLFIAYSLRCHQACIRRRFRLQMQASKSLRSTHQKLCQSNIQQYTHDHPRLTATVQNEPLCPLNVSSRWHYRRNIVRSPSPACDNAFFLLPRNGFSLFENQAMFQLDPAVKTYQKKMKL